MAIQTTSFKIARYILFALVLILCIWIIIWTVVSQPDKTTSNVPTNNVIRITDNS